jgi:hypothetical protein
MISIDNDQSPFPDDISSYSDDVFYKFVEEFVGEIEAEIWKVQRIRNVRILLRVPDVFSCFELECKEIRDLKTRACFVDDTRYVVRAGIRYNIEHFIDLLRKHNVSTLTHMNRDLSQSTTSASTAEIDHSLHEIMDIFKDPNGLIQSKPFVYAFVDNLLKNTNRSNNHYEYNAIVEKFASALYILAGKNTYEFLRLNLPGALPSSTTLENHNQRVNSRLNECEFRFESLKNYLNSIDSTYVYAVSIYKSAVMWSALIEYLLFTVRRRHWCHQHSVL